MYQYNQNDYNIPKMNHPLFGDFDPTTRATHPSEKITAFEHTIIIDSRQRNKKLYPTPAEYQVNLSTVYKNVTRIEYCGGTIPRSSYNVHSTNKYIDFSIGSSISSIKIVGGGSGFLVTPTILISPPKGGGIQATATAIINSGSLVSVNINISGTGYYNSDPPNITVIEGGMITTKVALAAVIGTPYTAVLREGQYNIGGNPTPPSTLPSQLILEIQNAMNYAVNGSPYDPTSVGPFEVRLVNQYPTLDAGVGTPEAFNTNACQFNRIQITNINSDDWELLFYSGPNRNRSSYTILGFLPYDHYQTTDVLAVVDGGTTILSAGTALRGDDDYDLTNDPNYVLLSFSNGIETFERLECRDSSINNKFATIIFDSVLPNTIKDTTGTVYTDGSGFDYLVGPITKGNFWLPPGYLKATKGADMDNKSLEFVQPIGKLDKLFIKFTKFGTDELYEFGGKEHMLIFNIIMSDNQSGQKA